MMTEDDKNVVQSESGMVAQVSEVRNRYQLTTKTTPLIAQNGMTKLRVRTKRW